MGGELAAGTGYETPRIRQIAIKEALETQKRHFQERIDKIDRMLSLLEKNPEVEEIINISRELNLQ